MTAERAATYKVRGPLMELTLRAHSRADPRARGGVLGLRLPDPARGDPRARVPQQAARRAAGRAWSPARTPTLAWRRLSAGPDLKPTILLRSRSARRRSRAAASCSWSRRTTRPSYAYDPTQPESRAARLAVDAALQRAAGRADAFTPGARRSPSPARATSTSWCRACSA